MNCSTCLCIGMSCGPAQLLAPVVLPVTLVYGTVQKIRALIAENGESYLSHQHDITKPECVYSNDRANGNMGNGYQACPYDEVKDLHESAKMCCELFIMNTLCIVPVLGGVLTNLYCDYICNYTANKSKEFDRLV